ncbi:RidA family protein [Kineosporia sp. NBRC 101731]|uniref:RidA family protein n=1 Tax=Kineosporia sp. NBRC 101731 TaxID=3032199 RepID=UPI0024A2758A|nr:RidA family protein [Kineosporia sp. NBRC 101731]GLY30978.1 enamine deaminase RidA [Kineosporia sp. NBRC 101731]
MSEFVNPDGVREVAAYTHAVVRRGTPVFLTGQVAWDPDGSVVGVGDIEAQIAQVWLNLTRVVEGLGASLTDIVKLTTYATDRSHMAAIGAERAKHFTPGVFPASTFLVVAGLADPDLLVEVEAIVMIES